MKADEAMGLLKWRDIGNSQQGIGINEVWK